MLSTIFAHASAEPNAEAMIVLCKDGSLKSYSRKAVWDMASDVADRISSAISDATDSRRIKTVCVSVSGGAWLPIVHLASLLARPSIALVPLNASDPRMRFVLEDSSPVAFVVTTQEEADSIEAIYRDIPTVSHAKFIILGSVPPRFFHDNRKLVPPNWSEYSQSDISHIFFTSGSTGRPKGCICTFESLAAYCSAKITTHSITTKSVVFVASSHTFDPSLGDHLSTLLSGGILACAESHAMVTSALQFCLEATRATHICTNPGLFESVKMIPATLKVVAVGGETLRAAVVENCVRRGVCLINTYGVTECAVYQMCYRVFDGKLDGINPLHTIEKALSRRKYLGPQGIGDTRIHVMKAASKHLTDILEIDPHEMIPVTGRVDGEIGELWISGAQVGEGYLNRELLTKSRFFMHKTYGKCFRTGDLVKTQVLDPTTLSDDRTEVFQFENDSSGLPLPAAAIEFLGRSDTQIKINGQRVEVEEVEHALLSELNTLVSNIAVVFNSDSKLLVAYVLPTHGYSVYFETESVSLALSSTAKHAQQLFGSILQIVSENILPGYMTPSRFVLVPSLPFTSTGKIDRSNLTNLNVLPPFDYDEEDLTHQTDERLKAWISYISRGWIHCLDLSKTAIKIGKSVRFSELGGDSLQALRVCKYLNEDLSRAGAVSITTQQENYDEIVADNAMKNIDGGAFGELLGILAPVELLKRQRLGDFAIYLASVYPTYTPFLKDDGLIAKQGPKSQSSIHKYTAAPIINAKSSEITSLLYSSLRLNLPQLTLYLISKYDVDLNILSPNPLHIACTNSNEDAVKILLQQGAKVSATDSRGATSLHISSQYGPLSLIKLIMNAYSVKTTTTTSKDKKSKQGSGQTRTPFSLVRQTDLDGLTCLHHASRAGAANSIVEYLIDAVNKDQQQALLDFTDKWGRTALHWATVNGHGNTVKLLVARGANVRIRDLEGEDAIEIAERRARCGAKIRNAGLRPSVFGDIAKMLGGSGSTKNVKRYK